MWRTLAFTKANGTAELVEPALLIDMLAAQAARATNPLKVVVLNACNTFELGYEIHRAGVPYVISWRTLVENAACSAFSAGFYHALAKGDSIGDCFAAGVLQMRAMRCTVGDPECHMVVSDTADNNVPLMYADGAPLRYENGKVLPFAKLVHGVPCILPEDTIERTHPVSREIERARDHSLRTKRIWAQAGNNGLLQAANGARELNAWMLIQRAAEYPQLVVRNGNSSMATASPPAPQHHLASSSASGPLPNAPMTACKMQHLNCIRFTSSNCLLYHPRD